MTKTYFLFFFLLLITRVVFAQEIRVSNNQVEKLKVSNELNSLILYESILKTENLINTQTNNYFIIQKSQQLNQFYKFKKEGIPSHKIDGKTNIVWLIIGLAAVIGVGIFSIINSGGSDFEVSSGNGNGGGTVFPPPPDRP